VPRALTWAAGLLLVAGAAVLGCTDEGHAADAPPKSDDCLACHADRDLKRGSAVAGRPASVFVDAAMLRASTHAGLECVACHTKATAPHDEKLPPVQCGGCHPAEPAALAGGAHRAVKGPRGAPGPGCAACHGTHDVRPAASLSPETCVGCHARQVGQYRDSIHGRARQRGDADAATCASCHGAAHTLVGKTDPRAPTYHLNLPRTCAQCHADSALARRHNIAVGNVYQLYMDSIHGRAVTKSGLLVAANCSDCHGSHGIKPRTDPASRVAHANVPATCGGCHAGVLEAYAKSVHGRAQAAGRPGAPVCTDCHSAHQIRRVEAAPWQLEAIRECGTCHEESLKTYRDTFHGKVTTLGFTRVAKCADCHGSHGILPAADPSSTVSTTRIVSTCRQCHTGATFSFTEFHPHADPHDRARFPKLYWVYVLMTGLLIGTFGFFGVHTVLWLPRSLVERLRRRGEG
jgi:DnaJ-class molecular chaperone